MCTHECGDAGDVRRRHRCASHEAVPGPAVVIVARLKSPLDRATLERILDLLDCEGCRAEMSREAKAYARSYAWPKIVDRMLTVYQDLGKDKFPILEGFLEAF